MAIQPEFEPYEGDEKYIFVSYSHKDNEKVISLMNQLHDKGYRIWYDDGIDLDEEWPEIVQNRLEKASLVLTFLSPNAIKSQNVRDEFIFAKNNKLPMINIFLDKTELKYGFKLLLGSKLYINYYEYPYDDKSFFKRLLRSKKFTKELKYSESKSTEPLTFIE